MVGGYKILLGGRHAFGLLASKDYFHQGSVCTEDTVAVILTHKDHSLGPPYKLVQGSK